jgi:hypothetical protein
MQRVTRSHLLDTDLHDFASMTVESAGDLEELDLAFDPLPGLMPNIVLNAKPEPAH